MMPECCIQAFAEKGLNDGFQLAVEGEEFQCPYCQRILCNGGTLAIEEQPSFKDDDVDVKRYPDTVDWMHWTIAGVLLAGCVLAVAAVVYVIAWMVRHG